MLKPFVLIMTALIGVGAFFLPYEIEPGALVAANTGPVRIATAVTGESALSRVAGQSMSVVPLKNAQNALMVDATLTNQRTGQTMTGTFIIDTGATYTSISHEAAEELGLDLGGSPSIRITTANGRIEVPKVTIDSVNVSGLEAKNVDVTVIPLRKGTNFSGLLGLSFIRQFRLTIDPARNQLIFQPN